MANKVNAVNKVKKYLLDKAGNVINNNSPVGVYKSLVGFAKDRSAAMKSQDALNKIMTNKYLGDVKQDMGIKYSNAEDYSGEMVNPGLTPWVASNTSGAEAYLKDQRKKVLSQPEKKDYTK